MYGQDWSNAVAIRDDLLISVIKEHRKDGKLSIKLIKRIEKQLKQDQRHYQFDIDWESKP
jgi:hypothetical protein